MFFLNIVFNLFVTSIKKVETMQKSNVFTQTEKAFRSESREAKSAEEPSTSDFNKDQSMETESDDDNPKCVICHLGRITSTKTEESLHSVQQSATPSTCCFFISRLQYDKNNDIYTKHFLNFSHGLILQQHLL